SYTQIAKLTSATDAGSNPTGSNISTYYKVKISISQTADTYTGKVKYTLVHPNTAPAPAEPLADADCPANTICYAPNANNIEGSMDSISETKISKSPTAGVQIQTRNNSGTLVNITSNSEATLIVPDYSRPGYGFAGWSPEFDTTTVTNPVIYGPNQSITFSTSGDGDADISEHGLILYPVWIASTGNLQNWQGCSSLTRATYDAANNKMIATLSSVAALTDQRDGDVYAVARLADGNCWMMENLRLDANSTTGVNSSLAQGYGGVFAGLDVSENSNFEDDNINATPTNMYNTTNITGDYQSTRIPRYNNVNTDRTLTARYREPGYLTYYRWHGYGNYYNWPAAIANTTFYNSSASESAETSLCPVGWKLPYGRYTGDNVEVGGFFYLNTLMSNNTSAQGSKDWRMFPNNYVYSGMFSSNYEGNRDYSGVYWSSTANQNTISATFYLAAGSISPGIGTYGKNIGLSVRCIVDF
ncbi:hypothetical protein IKF21_03280, partial [Candidatus Saccharibacteria bacterium]|nr:hypothetical protein [Candidatus Saccharibacteria bacterium]